MNPELAIDVFKNVVLFALYIIAPFIGAIMVVGLITSVLQSITSIQEQTLSFAPKLLAMAGVGILLGPWLIRSLSEFAIRSITQMSTMGQ